MRYFLKLEPSDLRYRASTTDRPPRHRAAEEIYGLRNGERSPEEPGRDGREQLDGVPGENNEINEPKQCQSLAPDSAAAHLLSVINCLKILGELRVLTAGGER